MRRLRAAAGASLLVAVATAMLAGCAAAGPTLESTGIPTPTVDPVTDLADGTSGTTEATDDGCLADAVGPDAGAVETIALDDATGGLLRVHRNDAGDWRIRIEADDGQTIDAPLQVDLATDPESGAIRPLGATDLDGDGTTELFSIVGDAPGAELVTIHARVGCALVPVSVGGASLSFPIGSRPMLVSGLACSDHDGDGAVDGVTGWIGLPDGTTADGTTVFRVDGVTYRLDGTELVQVDTASETGLDEPDAAAYGVLDCPDLPALGS